MPARSTAAALFLLAACVDRPLDGAPGGELGNVVGGYAPGRGWEARVEAYDGVRAHFAVVPLYDSHGRPVAVIRTEEDAAEETVLLTPGNDDDRLHRFSGFFDLPAWAWRDDRARVRVVLRAPRTTTFTSAFAYSNAAYHRCLLEARFAVDLRDLGAHCADRKSLVLYRLTER
jgi:hypothetical protein